VSFTAERKGNVHHTGQLWPGPALGGYFSHRFQAMAAAPVILGGSRTLELTGNNLDAVPVVHWENFFWS